MTETGETVIEMASTTERGETVTEIVKIQEVKKENTSSTYKPKIIFIGPLHLHKPELQPMDDLKKKYLDKLLNKSQNAELLKDRLIREARNMDAEVRGHYEGLRIISNERFARMLVKDGCFLLEFLSKKTSDDLGWLQRQQIDHDILLFENQIPFFVLKRFYHILRDNGIFTDADSNLEKVAYDYLNHMNMVTNNRTFLRDDTSICGTTSVSNLLHLYHKMLFRKNHQPPFINRTRIIRKWTMALFSWLFVIVSTPMYFIHKIFFADIVYPRNFTAATEIEEAGVRLQGSNEDLRFEQGTLLIPILALNQLSLCLLKNLMIFEFYYHSIVNPYVHTYVSFLSDLIMNPRDLKVMEKHHIIITRADGDESFRQVSDLFRENVLPATSSPSPAFHWQDLDVIKCNLWVYCQQPRHRWRAKLMKDYFGNPWSTLGVLAGGFLLVLTLIQTVFTVKSYYPH